jgi:hypothetical protein
MHIFNRMYCGGWAPFISNHTHTALLCVTHVRFWFLPPAGAFTLGHD